MRRLVLGTLVMLALGCADDVGDGELSPFRGDDSLLYASFPSLSVSDSDSEPIVVNVPAGATSIAVVLSNTGSTLTQPATITNPSGEVVFEVGSNDTNRVDAYSSVMTALVPVNPSVAASEGEWEFVFFGDGSASADVEALVRVDSSTSSGSLDLNIHFVGVDGLDASSASGDSDFQEVISGVRSTYQDAGISIGEIEYFDVDDDQYAVLETTQVGSDELLSMLREHTGGRDNRALNLFFVADIENPSSARSLLGVSAGVPGPPALHGLARSGVAINAANFIAARGGSGDLAEAKAEMTLVTAHEMGHYLGLFHTTEANGQSLSGGQNGVDPIDDSPVCQDSADSDSDGVLSAAECSGSGASNLMFWSPPNSARNLTSGQSTVLRRNPVVR